MNTDQHPIQLIKERFAELPPEVQAAVTASDLKDKMRAIGDKYNLLLDKQSDLQRLILIVMLGLMSSSEFVPSLMEELKISRTEANLIANDVSEQIFAPIRTHLREWEEQTETDLERLGDFTIDHTQTAGNESLSTEDNAGNGMLVERRPTILDSIENPQPAKRTFVTKTSETRTEPLTDHLLSTPVTVPPQRIVQPSTQTQKSADPYKESIA